MKRYMGIMLIGMVGMAVILGGCAKRIKPTPTAPGMQEEKVTPPPQTGELTVPGVEQPAITESEVAAGEEGRPPDLAAIYFDFDQYNIREDMRAPLEADAKWLLSHPKVGIMIEGHADERGTNEYNLALGERRARATKQFLMALGVNADRLSTLSFGEERPVCQEHEESCYWKNRRAYFMTRSR